MHKLPWTNDRIPSIEAKTREAKRLIDLIENAMTYECPADHDDSECWSWIGEDDYDDAITAARELLHLVIRLEQRIVDKRHEQATA